MKLPSKFQIGDEVAVFRNTKVVGVRFEHGKVRYAVENKTYDEYLQQEVTEFDVVNSEEVVEPITQ